MQCRKIDPDNVPTSIREFFTAEEFASISEYEKKHLSNLRQNFEVLRRAGLPVCPPEFMLRNKSNKRKQKLIDPPFIESSDGSDSEWTPALERTNKPRADQKKIFKPPKKVCGGIGIEGEQITTLHPKHKKRRKKQTDTTCEEEEGHVYPFRTKRVTSYMSLAIPEDDDFLYCEECNQEYDGDCPKHGALSCVDDGEVSLMGPNDSDEYSKRTLPKGLEIKQSKIPNAGLGVFALKNFPARTRFGPYRGRKETNEYIAHESGYSWQIIKDAKSSHFVDARDPCESNWMRYVNCARHEEEQCVTAYQYRGEIYYRSHKQIIAGTEILVYYGDSYAKYLGIQTQQFGRLGKKVLDKEDVEDCAKNGENDRIHSCTQCQLSFSNLQYLQKHLKHRHNDKYWKMKQTEMSADMLVEDKAVKDSDTEHSLGDLIIGGTASGNHVSKLTGPKVSENVKDLRKKIVNINLTNISNELNLQNKAAYITNKYVELDGTGSCDTSLKYNKSRHGTEKHFRCDVCEIKFGDSSPLKKHKRIHSSEKPYKCDVCSVGFSQSGHLKRHKRIHTGEKPYKCDVCSVGFTRKGSLKTHKRIHTGEKPYKCDVCSVGFSESSYIKKHKRIHTGERPYKCDVCSVGFSRSGHLKTHKRIHTGEKPYKCDVCSVGFTRKGSLKTHKRMHTGVRPYKCDVCSVGFSRSDHLKTHKRIHTGEKPYKCDVCSVGFTTGNFLKTHKRIHTGEKKPYKCDVCSVGFSESDHLKTHKRIHTGEKKPYKCDVCSVEFTYNYRLKQHCKKHEEQ